MKRARKPEQKEQRRDAILAAGWLLYQEQAFSAISMSGVAQQAGLAKGTLYLYFKTKEELFLAILTEKVGEFFMGLSNYLRTLPKSGDELEFGRLLADYVMQHHHVLSLMGMAPSVLEQNSDLSAVKVYKEAIMLHTGQTGLLFEELLEFIPPGGGAKFLLNVYTLILGVMQTINVPKHVQQLIEQEPHLKILNMDQEAHLAYLIGIHLKGLKSSEKTDRGG